jgi:hypothetical protein
MLNDHQTLPVWAAGQSKALCSVLTPTWTQGRGWPAPRVKIIDRV